MAEDKILPEGLRFFNKHENAPDFVIGSLVVTPADLIEFCKKNAALLTDYNGKKQMRLQVLKSQNGGIYSVVDTYKKGDPKPQAKATKPANVAPPVDENPDDLPF
jgi:hypothetical protein